MVVYGLMVGSDIIILVLDFYVVGLMVGMDVVGLVKGKDVSQPTVPSQQFPADSSQPTFPTNPN